MFEQLYRVHMNIYLRFTKGRLRGDKSPCRTLHFCSCLSRSLLFPLSYLSCLPPLKYSFSAVFCGRFISQRSPRPKHARSSIELQTKSSCLARTDALFILFLISQLNMGFHSLYMQYTILIEFAGAGTPPVLLAFVHWFDLGCCRHTHLR